MIMKYFNIAGPCNSAKHYMIDAATRLKGVKQLIDMEQYFVIHAARQSGKTTYIWDLTNKLNADGQYYALYCSLETVQNMVEPERGIPAILDCIVFALQKSTIPFTYDKSYDQDKKDRLVVILTLFLMNLVKSLDKPLVIFFDEADCLSDDTLILFLRQLRSGYNERSTTPFVHSIALVGMRNIRDYKAKIRPDAQSLGSASPFNIVAKSLTLKNFTPEEIAGLYQQHTDATGQIFEEDAIRLVWEQTQGQPWLVNAIASEVIIEILQSDYTKPVTTELVHEAVQHIILNRPTHIDSLLERLKEERVRKIIEPLILGEGYINRNSDDFLYACDLGIIRESDDHQIKPGNPIYAEMIGRYLSSDTQNELLDSKYPYRMPRYMKDGRIDVDLLMRDFQTFWHEHSEIWEKRLDYHEAAPHLTMMGFLQRVINGGGQIIREMAAGTGRLDICLIYENQKYPIELKIRYGEKYIENGLEQIARYMETHCCDEGWLVVFDRRSTVRWEDKLYMKKEIVNGKTITVVGV
jgi:hypothetical protein